MNPQFHIQIPRSPNLSKCHVVVSVTQQYETNVAETKKRKKRKLHHIGFAVYEVPPHMTRLTPLYVAEHVKIQFCHIFQFCHYFVTILSQFFTNSVTFVTISATIGCYQSFCGKRSSNIFHPSPWRLHCGPPNCCTKL